MSTPARSILAAAIIAALALLGSSAQTTFGGANIVVETDEDEVAVDGFCSLRQAISAANFDSDGGGDCEIGDGADRIEIPNGVYELDSTLFLTSPATLTGESMDDTILDGQGLYGVLEITTTDMETRAVVRDLTIRNGDQIDDGAPFNGGGLVIGEFGGLGLGPEDVFVDRVLFMGNTGIAGGAIIVNSGNTLEIQDSVFTANVGTAQGNAVFVGDTAIVTVEGSVMSGNGDEANDSNGGAITNLGELTITNTEIVNNTFGIGANGLGGGINNADDGTALLTNVTISGNRAIQGGAIYNSADAVVEMHHVTIADNEATTQGAGIAGGGVVQAISSILSSDDPTDTCESPVTDSVNSIDVGETCGLTHKTDKQNTDPLLEPLDELGGDTLVHPIPADSPAVDTADQSTCPPDDQRGAPRPQGNGCDIGAYESPFSATPVPTETPGPTETPKPTGTPAVTPTPTGEPKAQLQGDVDCDGDVDSVDALKVLRFVAGLDYEQVEPCPDISSGKTIFGDVDCDGDVDAVDALWILRFVAALSVTQNEPCVDIGEPL